MSAGINLLLVGRWHKSQVTPLKSSSYMSIKSVYLESTYIQRQVIKSRCQKLLEQFAKLDFFPTDKNPYFATGVLGGGKKEARMYIFTSVCVKNHCRH